MICKKKHYSHQILENIYREGYTYSKAGVLLSNFTDSFGYQMNLFGKSQDSIKSENLMQIVDEINLKEISRASFGIQGFRNTWRMKREIKSKRYTTKISEIPNTK